MSRLRRFDQRGQSALFDGFVFFAVMMLASVLVVVSSTLAFQERAFATNRDLLLFTHEARGALFTSTVPAAAYRDQVGTITLLYNYTVLDLLVVELALIDDGLGQDDFNNANDGVNPTIVALAERLIGQERTRHFAIFGTYGAGALSLFSDGVEGRDRIPFDRFASGVTTSMAIVGKHGSATVDLYVWV